MKKLLSIIAVLFVLSVCAIYLIIPKELVVSHSVMINTSDKNIFDFLKDKEKRIRWWPEKQLSGKKNIDSFLHYGKQTFIPDGLLYNSLAVNIEQDGATETSKILVVAVAPDTAKVVWECRLTAGLNPVKRIKQYFNIINTKESMVGILGGLKSFLDKSENIYGYPIAYERLTDTLYIAHTSILNTYPDTKLIITVLEKLRSYIKLNGDIKTGYPIMNISYLENGKYQTVIALPINTDIAVTKDFVLKRMPYKGRAITTHVAGGTQNILKGLEAIHKYESDFRLDQPIIPFFSLITDRAKETDSTKWITKIWGPIY